MANKFIYVGSNYYPLTYDSFKFKTEQNIKVYTLFSLKHSVYIRKNKRRKMTTNARNTSLKVVCLVDVQYSYTFL